MFFKIRDEFSGNYDIKKRELIYFNGSKFFSGMNEEYE